MALLRKHDPILTTGRLQLITHSSRRFQMYIQPPINPAHPRSKPLQNRATPTHLPKVLDPALNCWLLSLLRLRTLTLHRFPKVHRRPPHHRYLHQVAWKYGLKSYHIYQKLKSLSNCRTLSTYTAHS